MAEQWERREVHEVTVTGPRLVDAVDATTALHQAMSDYREIAGEPPTAEIPPGAVTLSAAGGVLSVRVEYVQTDGGEPVEDPDTTEGEDRG